MEDIVHPEAAVGANAMLRVFGAEENNLRNLDCEIPLGCLVAITGPSGSGKSSLLFDTIYREARYHFLRAAISSRSAKQMRLPRAAVKEIAGLSLAIGIGNAFPAPGSRTSFASFAGLYQQIRVLFRHFARSVCPQCQSDVHRSSLNDIITYFRTLDEGSGVRILAPILKSELENGERLQARLLDHAIHRITIPDGHARVEGTSFFSAIAEEGSSNDSDVCGLVDSFRCHTRALPRLIEAVEIALNFSSGVVHVQSSGVEGDDTWQTRRFRTEGDCEQCGYAVPKITTSSFSYYRNDSACAECHGYGELEGRTCGDCAGARLEPFVLNRRLFGASLSDILLDTVDGVTAWCTGASDNSSQSSDIESRALLQLESKLETLRNVGLGYLTLSRSLPSLSSGEMQRARIARELRQSMDGVLYCLDEPSAGLHPQDVAAMMSVLQTLCARGASVVFIDHDLTAVSSADYVLELGPGAGALGGELVAAGSASELLSGDSLTAQWARKVDSSIDTPSKRDRKHQAWLTCSEVSRYTLSIPECRIPLGAHTAVIGRSGSGKSTLLRGVIVPALRRLLEQKSGEATLSPEDTVSFGVADIDGWGDIRRVVDVGDFTSVRNKRSTVATLSGVLKPIRDLFSLTLDARVRGYSAAHFSFNSPSGRCPECRGEGAKLHVLEDVAPVEELCSLCQGDRYRREVLDVRYKGLSIVEILSLSVDAAQQLLGVVPKLGELLSVLKQSGLGYLTLNQRSDTLSTGELQRLRLAQEIALRPASGTLYVFDEPSRGLHAAEVSLLNDIFRRLLDSGATIVTIEHNEQVIREADYFLVLGPGSGASGGKLVAQGSYAAVASKAGFGIASE